MKRLFIVCVALGLATAACGDGEAATTTVAQEEPATRDSPTTTAAATTTTASPTTTEAETTTVAVTDPLIELAESKVAAIEAAIPADYTYETVVDVDGADKLIKLTVDFGDHRRTILAGLKEERENLADLKGRQALFVVNLKPRRMRGEISEGMLFDIGYPDGVTPCLAVPERPLPNGARAG